MALKLLTRLWRGARAPISSRRLRAFKAQLQEDELSVLRGIGAFKKGCSRVAPSHPLLRRNIHRLEKGLCMPSRRASFAKEYIEETVRLYEIVVSSADRSEPETLWVHDVLERYFSVTDKQDPRIAVALQQWLQVKVALPPHAPYQESDLAAVAAGVTAEGEFGALLSLARRRRSQRWFSINPS